MPSKGLRTHVEVVGGALCVGGGVDGGGGGAHAEAEGVLRWGDHSQMMFAIPGIRPNLLQTSYLSHLSCPSMGDVAMAPCWMEGV